MGVAAFSIRFMLLGMGVETFGWLDMLGVAICCDSNAPSSFVFYLDVACV